MTFAQLRDARPDLWQQASNDWLTASKHAANCADEIRAKGTGPVADHWQDEFGQQAGSVLADLANRFEAASDEMRGAVMVLDALTEAIGVAQRDLQAVIEQAKTHNLSIDDGGQVSPTPGRPFDVLFLVDTLNIQSEIDEALREATQADQKAAGELQKIRNSVDLADPTRAVQNDQVDASHVEMDILAGTIPQGAGSLAVASWWSSLTPQQQQQLELAEPTVIAGLNGIPQDVKDSLHGDGKYDRMKLVQFALDHWNDSDIDAFDNNCANFVSTALHESGVQLKNDGSGTLGDNTWVEGAQTGWKWLDAHDYSHSATWAQAGKLHDFLTSNGSQEIPLNQVRPGDIIFFDQNSPNPGLPQGQIHHAAIVTAVTPDGDIKYTQHTDNEQNLSLDGRQLHEDTVEGQQKIVAVRVQPNWY